MTITTAKISCHRHVIRHSTTIINHAATCSTIFIMLLLSPQVVAAQQPPTPNTLQSYINLSPTILLVIIIFLFLVLGFISIFHPWFAVPCFGICFPTATLRGGGNPNHGQRAEARGLDNDVIETFPTFLYSDVKMHRLGKSALECAVCLSEFEDDDVLRLLPWCSHVFHPNCIDPWLTSHVTCPVCRANLLEQAQVGRHENNYGTWVVENLYADQCEPSDRQIRQQLHRDHVVDVGSPSWSNDNHEMNVDRRCGLLLGYGGDGNIGKFPRSHSTGHSVVWIGGGSGGSERFTLRLPEEVREKLMNIRWDPTGSDRGRETLLMSTMSSPRRGYRTTSLGRCRLKNGTYYEPFGGGASSENNKVGRWGFPVAQPFLSVDRNARRYGHRWTYLSLNSC